MIDGIETQTKPASLSERGLLDRIADTLDAVKVLFAENPVIMTQKGLRQKKNHKKKFDREKNSNQGPTGPWNWAKPG